MTHYFIVPGWSEGRWHIDKFQSGAKISLVNDPADADVIICHSSGCYSIPKTNSSQTVVLIDPPYWPGRSIVKGALQHVIFDAPKQIGRYGLVFWLNMRLHNVFYAILAPLKHTIHLQRSLKKELLTDLEQNTVFLIRNQRDAYCAPAVARLGSSRIKILNMPGLHEDCWVEPAAVISLIR